jgi:methylenetetrahydrofolate reductase (NADPH)
MTQYPSSIALEIPPRAPELLLAESKQALQNFSSISAINIPEIQSIPIKSFEATQHLLRASLPAIPHFRTIDRSLEELERMVAALMEDGLKEVLLISGDPPKDNPNFVSSGLTPCAAVRGLKARFPGLRVYTGLDSHRTSFRKELDYCSEKLEAGTDGFFTQPFFSENSLGLWLEQLPKTEIWVGVSPVTTSGSRKYWERINQVVFPPNFTLDLESNCILGRRLLDQTRQANQKAYLMPITITTGEYLSALFR